MRSWQPCRSASPCGLWIGSIWGTTRDDTLDRIDPDTGKVIASIKLSDDGWVDCNNRVLATSAAVFVNHCDEQEWIRIDPATNRIVSRTANKTLIDQARARNEVPAGKGTDFIWRVLQGGLLRMDPRTGAGLTFLPLRRDQISGYPPAVTDDSVWVGGLSKSSGWMLRPINLRRPTA